MPQQYIPTSSIDLRHLLLKQDDLSTESGDWVDAISKPEEVDEDGVALLPLNNDASTSILDAPGDLRVGAAHHSSITPS